MDALRPTNQYSIVPYGEVVRAQNQSGRLILPVSGASGTYARLKYITGIPSFQGGYSLSRLQSLDHLIGALIQTGKMSGESSYSVAGMDQAGVEEAVSRYAEILGEAFGAAPDLRGYAVPAAAGMVLDLAV